MGSTSNYSNKKRMNRNIAATPKQGAKNRKPFFEVPPRYMAYIPGSTFLENNRIEGSGAYKWNVCYAIRTVRLPGLASLSLPCRGRSIPKKGSSYLKGIPKRASSLFRISAILSARAASSVSGLHVFHSELPPLTRACLRLDRLDTSYIRRIIVKE